MPILALYAYQGEVNVNTLLFLRFSLGTLFFFLYVFLKIKKWSINKVQLISLFVLGGIFYTVQSSCYYSSVKYIPASLAVLIFYTYPIFVVILSFFIDKERLTKQTLASVGLSFFGLILVLGTSVGMINFLGVLFAIGAAVTYSCYIILGNRVVKQLPPMLISAFVALFASISLLLIGLSTNNINFNFETKAWLPIGGLVLFSTLLSMFTFFRGLELIGSTKAAILSMIEPLVTIGFSALLFYERLTLLQWFGGAAVLFGALLVVLAQEQKNIQETM